MNNWKLKFKSTISIAPKPMKYLVLALQDMCKICIMKIIRHWWKKPKKT